MFHEQETHPRLFAEPLGVDFAQSVVSGLKARLAAEPPESMARVTLIVNTSRMSRRIKDLFLEGEPGFLPRILLLSDIDRLLTCAPPPAARSKLQRMLQLSELLFPVLKSRPEMATRMSVFDLASSLAELLDEMQGEGVDPEIVQTLDVTDESGHWAQSQALIGIALTYLKAVDDGMDAEARSRKVVETLHSDWQEAPPKSPIILAGSTGSRGTTALLMQAVANLPQGAVILPGFDADMPGSVWSILQNKSAHEDHPQYRFAHLANLLGLDPSTLPAWNTAGTRVAVDRCKAVSLALRPAPVTDAWLTEGDQLPDLSVAMRDVTLVEAPNARQEALCIALRLRKAVEDGQTAALITPDRLLTRQVTAALDRWGILPDDSAGAPLHLSAPGRFLRHTSQLFTRPVTAESLMILLKHPLTQSGEAQSRHGLYTQQLEIALRRQRANADVFSSVEQALKSCFAKEDANFENWSKWIKTTFFAQTVPGALPISTWLERHRSLSECIASGGEGSGDLWNKNAGIAAAEVFASLTENAAFGGDITAHDYERLLLSCLQTGEVRDRDAPNPNVMIWGTLEARVQGAELVILSGLNEGVWPEAIQADPWLNRRLRKQSGLLLPDRRIGLAAHDFQQALASKEVWTTRAVRSDESETVASRWINRITYLLNGVPRQNGPQALQEMRQRGQWWMNQSEALEHVEPTPPARRAAPRPPVEFRPRDFTVTEIKTLIRDPYAIYAKHTLGLRKLDQLSPEPDAALRGIVFHKVMEQFVKSATEDDQALTVESLMRITDEVLSQKVESPAMRLFWRQRLHQISDWIVETEKDRRTRATPHLAEATAKAFLKFPDLGASIRGQADRIDLTIHGTGILYDYKSGAAPSPEEQKHFDKQLLIEAAILEEGGFEGLGPTSVEDAIYISLASKPGMRSAPLKEETPSLVLSGLKQLIATYLSIEQPYVSRRMVKSDSDVGDYDHLARFGEWDAVSSAEPEDL